MDAASGKTPNRFGSNAVVTLAAILVSVCALAVSVYQAKIMRETQRASVWPFVEVLPSNTQNGGWLGITNKGVGPAIIQTVYLEVDGQPFRRWQTLFDALAPEDSINFTWSSVTGRVLAPNEEVRAIQLNPSDARRVAQIIGQMSFEICYCSVYDECWQTNLNRKTLPVDACVVNSDRRFSQ
ncbi:MAG: hypothetical protein AAF402_11275 [Pseudomonadota bacterium]